MELTGKNYQMTEVGLIPKDWDVKLLMEICSPAKARINPLTATESYKCVELEHLSQETGRLLGYADTKDLKSQKTVFQKNDILFGKLRPYLKKYLFAKFDGVCTTEIWVLKSPSYIDNKWLYYLVQSNRIVEAANQSTGTKMPRAEWKTVGNTPIPLPSTKSEQISIATAFSDIDALIENLEKLIAKKRDIKQGVMQGLLTGKKGLSGFSGEWVIKTLSEVIDCLDNLRIPLNDKQRASMKGDYPYCGANGVLDYINDYCFDDDIILIAEDGGYFDEYFYRPIAYRMSGKCWVNNHAHVLKAKAAFNQDYIYYSLVHKNILEFLTSGTRAKLNKSELYNIEIQIPKDKKEQDAISKIINDIDIELTALNLKLNKSIMIKQGMMQILLTGKVRLL